MEPSQLTETERESFDRAMATIDGMSDEDRRAVLARWVAASIRYAGKREEANLAEASKTLLRTLRLYANPSHVRAMARRAAADLSRPPIQLSEKLAGLSQRA